jgi:cardiolipin synthase
MRHKRPLSSAQAGSASEAPPRPWFLRLQSLPNLITIGRLVLVPAIIGMIVTQKWTAACVIFIVAGLSDALDGWLAKTFDLCTELGAFLDPLADKALLISIYATLAVEGVVPPLLAILVVARDLMIIAAVLLAWIMDRPLQIKPLFISRVNTAVQIIVAAIVLITKALAYPMGLLVDSGFYLVAALTLLSMAAYLQQWLRRMTQ